MKKLFLMLLMAVVTLGASAQGQGPRRQFNPEDMAKRQASMIKESCSDLTDEQYTAIYNLYLESSKKQQAERDSLMKAGGQGERPRFDREAMQKRQDEMNAKLKTILSETQYKAYEEAMKKLMERMRQGGFGGGFGGGQR